MSFWFAVLDADGDDYFSEQDALAIHCDGDGDGEEEEKNDNDDNDDNEKKKEVWYETIERSWIELCDRCNVPISSTLSLQNIIKKGDAASFCFQRFILLPST